MKQIPDSATLGTQHAAPKAASPSSAAAPTAQQWALANNLLTNQIRSTAHYPDGITKKQKEWFGDRAQALLTILKPADPLEAMLCSQMVAVHTILMQYAARAENAGSLDFADSSSKIVAKLSLVWSRQLETLNKHRGKGAQKVTVEHIHKAPGAQATVGIVNEGPATTHVSQQPNQPAPEAFDGVGTRFDADEQAPPPKPPQKH